ncbi:MAG: DedA family protein [Proteobacteria bacterium]|nr:DedA family protein [Pseudomonadota bacterium]
MVETIIETLKIFTVGTIGQLGYFGILLLMAIESACIPLPSEIIMPFAGYLVSIGYMNLWIAALIGAIGCNLGSEIAYWIGYAGGRAAIYRYGKYVLLSPHELEIAEKWFAKHGEKTVFIARLLPVIRTFIAFPAGVAKMKRLKFHIYTFIGSYPWCLMLTWVGYKMGKAWDDKNSSLRHVLHNADAVIIALILIGVIWFIRSRIKAFKSLKERI